MSLDASQIAEIVKYGWRHDLTTEGIEPNPGWDCKAALPNGKECGGYHKPCRGDTDRCRHCHAPRTERSQAHGDIHKPGHVRQTDAERSEALRIDSLNRYRAFFALHDQFRVLFSRNGKCCGCGLIDAKYCDIDHIDEKRKTVCISLCKTHEVMVPELVNNALAYDAVSQTVTRWNYQTLCVECHWDKTHKNDTGCIGSKSESQWRRDAVIKRKVQVEKTCKFEHCPKRRCNT